MSSNFIGRRFGRLEVISFHSKTHSYHTKWNCLCDCGGTTVARRPDLVSGGKKSCGCISHSVKKQVDYDRERIKRIHRGMKRRCYEVQGHAYARYGARGIYVCDAWLDSFDNFYSWAIDNGYNCNLSIDRIDSDGPYSPENCRWATATEQNNNRKDVEMKRILFGGEKKTLSQWAVETGIPYDTIRMRIRRLRWSADRALTEPVNENCRPLNCRGKLSHRKDYTP